MTVLAFRKDGRHQNLFAVFPRGQFGHSATEYNFPSFIIYFNAESPPERRSTGGDRDLRRFGEGGMEGGEGGKGVCVCVSGGGGGGTPNATLSPPE